MFNRHTLLILALTVLLSSCVVEALKWSSWYDRDNPSGNGDNEERRLQTSNVPCGGKVPVAIQVRERVGSSWRYLLTTDVHIRVGPVFGIVCENKDNKWTGKSYPQCSDFEIRHSITKGKFQFSGPWMNRDRPSGGGDGEWGYLQSEKLWSAMGTSVVFRTKPTSRARSHREVEQFIHVGANFGLVCNNQENIDLGLGRCRDYSVRYLCN